MAAFFDKFINKFSNYEEDDYDDDFDYVDSDSQINDDEPAMEAIARPQTNRRTQPKLVDFKSGNGNQVIVVKPQNMEAAHELCNHLRAGRTVICNFEQVDQKIAQRIVDFITGSAYALDGQVRPVSNLIFVIVPRAVTLMDGLDVYENKDYLNTGTIGR